MSPRRVLDRRRLLPDDGWVTKQEPAPLTCSWCDADLAAVRGVVLCPSCDCIHLKPVPA